MSRSQRIGWAGALATVLVAASLHSVVQGVGWFVEVVLAVLVVAGTGALASRWLRPVALVAACQAVALLVLLTWLFALPEASFWLLPGPQSLSRLLDLGAAGVATAEQESAPAPGTEGLRLLVTAGIGLVALVVDVTAAALRQPAAAGLPLLAVYCVPAALAGGGLDWYWFLLAAGGYLALVSSDATSRIARWGKVLSGQGGEQAPLAATGRRVGALALVVAVVLPSLVPGLSEGLLPGGSGGGGGPGGRIEVSNPLFDLRDNLGARADIAVMTYTTDQPDPEPMRWVIADAYDGNTWGPTTGAIPREQRADGALPDPPGLTDASEVTERTTRITIADLGQSAYLPAPYPPVEVDVEGDWLYELSTLNIIGDGVSTAEGLEYTVRHLDVAPDAERLAEAGPAPADVVERWTTLPPNLPATITDTARRVAGEADDFQQATNLQSFFRTDGGFQYSEEAPGGSGTSAISDFLERRSGFCVHFAATMAVMARAVGIPARVAVGFLPGEETEEGVYRVSLRDAHAWPELYFAGAGWMRFEPTPATRTGAVPGWALPVPDPAAPAPAPTDAPATAAPQDAGPDLAADEVAEETGFDLATALRQVPWRVVAALVVLFAVLAAPRVTTTVVRARRWRRAGSPAEHAEAAWTTLAQTLTDLGVGWPVSATPRQVEEQVGDGLSERGREALHRLARAVEQARYAVTPRFGDGRGLRHDVAVVVHAVREKRPGSAYWRARLMPRSGVEQLRAWMVDSGLRFDAWERRAAARLGTWWRRVTGRLGKTGGAHPGDGSGAAPAPGLGADGREREKVGPRAG